MLLCKFYRSGFSFTRIIVWNPSSKTIFQSLNLMNACNLKNIFGHPHQRKCPVNLALSVRSSVRPSVCSFATHNSVLLLLLLLFCFVFLFQIFCMKLERHKVKEVTNPSFRKKSLNMSEGPKKSQKWPKN